MKKMNKKGFTLVEIMIVVAIIGLLAAIGIPSFTKARSNSQEKSCVNNLRMLDSAKEQWAMETNQAPGADEPATTDLDVYVKGGTAALKCAQDKAQGFGSSYTIGALGVNAVCQIDATGHIAK